MYIYYYYYQSAGHTAQPLRLILDVDGNACSIIFFVVRSRTVYNTILIIDNQK